ncbi:MAG: VOC family protein [Fidelibacterota bacterium]|nr:MAG: VOC family protein [Candidatus Neomarinimicrobiota bacterium]
MERVVHFEINAQDPQRAADFYTEVFGWSIGKWEGPMDYWLITTGEEDEPGINGAIMTEGRAPVINTIDVPSAEEAAAKVTANGGRVLGEIQAIPGVGYHVYCQDTEGVVFGLIQDDLSAA